MLAPGFHAFAHEILSAACATDDHPTQTGLNRPSSPKTPVSRRAEALLRLVGRTHARAQCAIRLLCGRRRFARLFHHAPGERRGANRGPARRGPDQGVRGRAMAPGPSPIHHHLLAPVGHDHFEPAGLARSGAGLRGHQRRALFVHQAAAQAHDHHLAVALVVGARVLPLRRTAVACRRSARDRRRGASSSVARCRPMSGVRRRRSGSTLEHPVDHGRGEQPGASLEGGGDRGCDPRSEAVTTPASGVMSWRQRAGDEQSEAVSAWGRRRESAGVSGAADMMTWAVARSPGVVDRAHRGRL